MKILFITPHLSTGGGPQYLLKKIELLHNQHEIYCVEYSNITGGVLIVQRSQILNLLGNRLITLGENKLDLLEQINLINPDIIHFEEMPEFFCDVNLAKNIYRQNRSYKIIETSHDSSFDPKNKLFFPDRFAFISEYQRKTFSCLNIPMTIVEYPIEYKQKCDRTQSLLNLGLDPRKTHFLNVGLFTQRKNQSEIIEYAKSLINENVQFHFVGNQADNFRSYWEPLMKNFPSNCKWWGERKDVDTFYNALDVFLFTSRGHANDKETSPLVIRESIGWNMPILMYNLPVYCGMYDKYKNINWLSGDYNHNVNLIKNISNKSDITTQSPIVNFEDLFDISFDGSENKINLFYKKEESTFLKISIKDVDSNMPIYYFDYNFANYVNWWIIPISKQLFNFESESNFRGFKIELYDSNNKFTSFKNFYIKNVERERTVYIDVIDPFDCLFYNYTEMFVENKYDCYNIENLDVVIDIGANAGLFTKLCLMKNVKQIFSVEPNKKSLLNLKHITKYDKNVTVIEKAVSDTNKISRFYTSNDNSTISCFNKELLQRQHSNITEYDVECLTVKDLINEYNLEKISLLKMDVEGSEYSIIKSLTKDIFNKIDSFLIEFHENRNGEVKDLVNILTDNGFEINQIRKHSSQNNDDIKNSYYSEPNGTIYAIKSKVISKKLPKIKAVHLQTNLNDDREQKSRKSLELLKDINIDVVLHTNELYTSLPPSHNCQRPSSVSIHKVNDDSLTPAHYGCFESFRLGILSEFDDELDFLMVCEGDCLIEVSSNEFKNILSQVCEIMDREKIDYFSLGDYDTLQTGIRQSNVIYTPENQNICYVTERIIGLQCILFSKNFKKRLFEYLRTSKWDAADIYFNNMSWNLNIKRAILNKRITTQCDGISLIDSEYKQFIKK